MRKFHDRARAGNHGQFEVARIDRRGSALQRSLAALIPVSQYAVLHRPEDIQRARLRCLLRNLKFD